jgi:hypothetical protein
LLWTRLAVWPSGRLGGWESHAPLEMWGETWEERRKMND